jgi:oxaloacetate decarboxylase alpha subunit
VNLREIRELIKMLNGTDIVELNLEKEGFRLNLKKRADGGGQNRETDYPAIAAVSMDAAKSEMNRMPSTVAEGEDDNYTTIVAPMVGTFYRAPSPDAPPYVNVGDEVEVGQPLCIIEAMKLMNEIESEVKGRIIEILVENAQPVEYGQPLFIIEPL